MEDNPNPFDSDSGTAWTAAQGIADLDWQDGFNPECIDRGPYVNYALESPTMRELRYTPGLELIMYAAPDSSVATMHGKLTYDTLFSLPAGAWIVGMSAHSPDAAGFLVQVTLPDGTDLVSVPMTSQDLAGAVPYFLAEPAGLPVGGEVTARLINQASGNNAGQLVLWVIQPEPTPTTTEIRQ
jgi:hypothetical protein